MPGGREAFGVRVALAPPSDETRNSTQLVAPKSDEGGRREDAKAQGKPVSFSACPPRMNLLDKTAKLVRTDCNAMKPTFFTTSLLFLALSSVACVAEARYVTLSVSGTNQTEQLTLQDFEVARLVSASDPQSAFSLTVAKSSFSTFFLYKDLQGCSFCSPYYVPPKSIVATGPATFTLMSGIDSRSTNNGAFITFEILPETSPVDKTLIVPPGTNRVEITLESSTNLVSWATATNGVYGSPDEARFFRIHLRKLN